MKIIRFNEYETNQIDEKINLKNFILASVLALSSTSLKAQMHNTNEIEISQPKSTRLVKR